MKIGDKVVCVDAGPCVLCGKPVPLVSGLVYVVRSMEISILTGNPLVVVIGRMPECHRIEGQLQAYVASRFRLLDELKQESWVLQHSKRSNAAKIAAYVKRCFLEG